MGAASERLLSTAAPNLSAQRPLDRGHDPRHGAARPFRTDQPDIVSISSTSLDGSDDSDLPDICDIGVSRPPRKPRSPLRRSYSDTLGSAARSNPASSRIGGTRNLAQAKKRAAKRAAEKESKRRERERIKEAKAKDRERAVALAEANKLRTDKNVSTPEMIVHLPSSLGPEHREQVQILLTELGVDHAMWESDARHC